MKLLMWLFWGILFILLAFRHELVGIDLLNYKSIFNFISASDWTRALSRSPEMAWSFMNKLISMLGGDFRVLLVITAILSVFWLAKAYLKYLQDISLTISLLIIMPNFILLFSGLRQAIAISLGFLAFEFVRNKKMLAFVTIVAIAILFHISAFLLLFMYPLYHAKIRKKHLIFIIPALLIVWVFNRSIFGFLSLILNQFTDYDTNITETGSVTILILFILLAVFSYVVPEESKMDADTIGMRNFLLLSVAIQMFAPLHNLAMRMNYYYIIFIPLLIPKIIACKSERWSQFAVLGRHVMVAFFLIYFFVNAGRGGNLNVFPYHFFWEDI